MKRCLAAFTVAASVLMASLPAQAQSLKRPFPKDALRGTLPPAR